MNAKQHPAAATETKVCTKCHEEKVVALFDRRGTGRQNICKACRKITSQIAHNKRVKKDNSANYEVIGARIEKLEAKIRAIAKVYSHDPMEADDVYSYICEKLLNQMVPNAPDAHYLATAKRRAKDCLAQGETYTMYVGAESSVDSDDASENKDGDAFETFIGDQNKSAEEIAIKNEERAQIAKAVSALDERNCQIVSMLAEGSTQAEIARELGITAAAICYRMETIRKILGALLPNALSVA